MNCPKCSGAVMVRDTTYTEENEIYRRKKCRECGHVFYTMEFEVEDNPAFRAEWSRLIKTAKPAWVKTRRKIYTLYLRENGETVASGTVEECAKRMGISVEAMRTIISRTHRGIIKRYDLQISGGSDEELEEE
jgi:transcriptional regulator NrdR family protein